MMRAESATVAAVALAVLFPVCASALVAPATGRRVSVAAWQGAAVAADVPANVARVTAEVAAAAESGVEVLLFPELFLHGYDATHAQLQEVALRQDAPELRAVADAAKSNGVCVGVPYCERCSDDDVTLYNSMAVFDATGTLACNYRKVNLWGEWEHEVFERGEVGQFTPFDLQLASGVHVKTGCLICFDIEFPEPARTLAVQGAELLLVPTALGAGPRAPTCPTASRRRPRLSDDSLHSEPPVVWAGDVEMTTPFAVVVRSERKLERAWLHPPVLVPRTRTRCRPRLR
jgi:predicted amidohydrolase